MHYLKMIRPFDYIIVLLLFILSFTPYVIFARQEAKQNAASTVTAVVTHDGQEVYRVKLTGHRGTTRFHYRNGQDVNEIVVTDQMIAITEANCGDQVCVRKGKIHKPGQTIVCLPHKLLISIKSSGNSGGNDTGGMVAE